MSYGSYCMVKNCGRNRKDFPDLSFFTIPKKMEIALKWIDFSGREDIDLSKRYTMCSEHFAVNQFKTIYPRKLLYAGSIPCMNGPPAMKIEQIESDRLNTDGRIAFMMEPYVEISEQNECIQSNADGMKGPHALKIEQIESDTLITDGSMAFMTEPYVVASEQNECNQSNTDGSIAFMEEPYEMVVEQNECNRLNTDDMPLSLTGPERSSSLESVFKSSPRNDDVPLSLTEPEGSSSLKRVIQCSPRSDKRIQRMKKTINALRCKLYRNKVSQCSCKGRPLKSSNKATIEKLINESKSYLSKEAHIIFTNELRASYVKKNNRRYDDSLREICLRWYYASPEGYKLISKCLSLPNPRTLKNWQLKVKLSPGISQAMIESLRLHFSDNTEQKKKICCLMFDKIVISEDLQFDQSNGKVVGVVDTGTVRRNDKATTALVCMARGVAYNWKYILGYWFLDHTATNEYLYSIVVNSIDAAQRSGLKVKAIICDQSPVNQSVAEELEISTEQCFFFRNDEKIYFIYDVHHLLRSIRNNLAKYDLDYSGKLVSWNYIKQTCTSTNPVRVRLLPKITKEHLKITTSNVKYAAQILSESVSVAMFVFMQLGELSEECIFTSDFISDINKVFDCLTSSKLVKDQVTMRYAMSENSPHRDFLIKIRDNFRSSKFLSKESVPPCINGFITTINSILQLADDLRNIYDIPKLLTCHLTRDSLENFFATVRQQRGCCPNPSPQQLENCLQNNHITSITDLYSNSSFEEDLTFSLEKLKELTSYENKEERTILELKDIEDVQIDLKEENAVFYVGGYMVKKFLKLHPCDLCSDILCQDKDKLLTGQQQIFTYFKQGESIDTENDLVYTSQELLNYIEKLEIIHNENFDELLCSEKLVKDLMDIVKLKHKIEFSLCSPASSDTFLQLFMTIRCYWGVQLINRGNK